VLGLVKTRKLPAGFEAELQPFVRDKYLERWCGIAESPPGPDEG
jgi:hypothetical protein